MRYSTPRSPSRRRHALANPVAKSIAVRQIHQHLRGIQTLAYLLDDGEDVASQLAHMAWVIGLGTEVAYAIGHQRARVLHDTLCTVHGMALAGCCWQARHAAAVDTALSESATLMTTHPEIAWTMVAGAEFLAHRIHTRTTTAADVAGVEFLNVTPAQEIPPLAPPAQGGGGARQAKAGEVDGQQAAARPEGLGGSTRRAGAAEVMDDGLARPASPALSSGQEVDAC